MDTRTFERQLQAESYDTVLHRTWLPNTVVEPHTHEFAAKALVLYGEMWLTVGDVTRHLFAGDTFELPANVVHDERYGELGATYLVGRRNLPG